MKRKLERFVASLTDQEIDNQLEDIFEFAKVYKTLLEKEKADRQMRKILPDSKDIQNDYHEYEEHEEVYEYEDDEPDIDYELAQAVLEKVSALSCDETRDRLERLRNISSDALSSEELAILQYDMEVCELHLLELTGKTADGTKICPVCSSELDTDARFCGNCGSAVRLN